MALLNDFKLGADPEFVLYNDGHILNFVPAKTDRYAPWGTDHGGWVIEPHPKPALSVRDLIQNLKTSLNDFATVAPPCQKWRAGAYLKPAERAVTLGGHVHIDKPAYTAKQAGSFDLLTKHLEALDILPAVECVARRAQAGTGIYKYGTFGDFRIEHGHFEYRTMPSWLFSQRVTKLCLIASKLIMLEPEVCINTLGDVKTASIAKLKTFIECFKGKDDDVDWILASRMMDRKLNVKPDRDLRDVWAVTPLKETPRWKEAEGVAKDNENTALTGDAPPAGPFYGRLGTLIYEYDRPQPPRLHAMTQPRREGQDFVFGIPTTWDGHPLTFIAREGTHWPIGTPVTTIRTTRYDHTFNWIVPARLKRTPEVNYALREWVDHDMHLARTGVQFFRGFAFEFAGEI